MQLHPRSVVSKYLKRHLEDFVRVRQLLDEGIQHTAAQWEDKIAFRRMDPCARASDIRQYFSASWTPLGDAKDSLTLDVRFNNGLHLYTPDKRRIRIKLHPRTSRTGALLPATDPDAQLSLFEDSTSPSKAYELAVLWSIDFYTATLESAVLAAADFGLDDQGPSIIYAKEEIPAIATCGVDNIDVNSQGTNPRSRNQGPTDDFEEFLQSDGEETGPDSA
jgi:hypothetical protein